MALQLTGWGQSSTERGTLARVMVLSRWFGKAPPAAEHRSVGRQVQLKRLAGLGVLLVGLSWFVFTMRIEGIPFLLIAVGGLLFVKPWATPKIVLVLIAAFVALAWSPIAVTFINADGGPRVVRCCPGSPYRDLEAASARMRAGECMLCSDLSTGFEPRWYVLW